MRTQAEVDSIVAEAKIAYSKFIQDYESDKQKGIQKEDWDKYFAAQNIFSITDDYYLSLQDKSLCVDYLVRNGFILNQDNNRFSESEFDLDLDFDTL